MKTQERLVAAMIIMAIVGILSASTTAGLTGTAQTISSSGTITASSISLTLSSSANPAKTASAVLISGQISTGRSSNYSSFSINLQYSRDQYTWLNISTVTADSDGTFKRTFAFSSSGIYFVRAICGGQESSYSQLVADRLVNLNGLEDSTNIQSAINSLPPIGGIVYIRSGLFDLGGRSLILRSNLTLIGDGIDRTIVRLFSTKHTVQMGSEDALTSESNIENLLIENFTLIQNAEVANHHGGVVLRGSENDDITVRNLKVTDSTGAGIGIRNVNNLLIENCRVERTWTGITILNSSNAAIRNNVVIDTRGDGILPQQSASEVVIENNRLENIGDTAIDVSGPSTAGTPSHKHIVVRNNDITNGTMRVTNAMDVQIVGNTIQYGEIAVDAGLGRPTEVKIVGNQIVSDGKAGIAFYGAANSSAENNIIRMIPPSENITQSGIIMAIWDTGLIAGNTIENSANYGIDFGNWGLGGGNNLSIRGNTIQNYGNFGVYDNNKYTGIVRVEGNVITSNKATATRAIFTQNPANQWIIDGNT